MAPYIAQHQGFTEQYIKSGDPILGLSKASHTLGKPMTGSPGVRREGLGPHPEAIAMLAPTIRVIHVFAPKIIKTDVANFRSTVQRLTGRPRCKADTATPQRRARTKTVSACAATSSPDSVGFQDTDHGQLLSRQRVCAPHADSMFQSRILEVSTEQDSPIRRNTMEMDNCSLVSNGMDSSFSFYMSSVDSPTSNHELLHINQISTSIHSPGSDHGCSFFSHRQAPYALNEIPAPFFDSAGSGSDFLSSTELLMPNNSQDYAYQTYTAPCALTEITSFMPLPSIPPLDYNGLAAGFSDLDILAGLGSTLPDLPLNLPPLAASSTNGLFNDSMLMQPPLCSR